MLRVLLLFTVVLCRNMIVDMVPLATGYDKVCNPSGIAFRYTGLRLYRTVIIDWPVRHFWYLVRCTSGSISSQQYFPTNRTSNFYFSTPVTVSNDEMYIFARHKKYALRNIPVFRPFAEIGTIFTYNRTANTSHAIMPLYADNPASEFSQSTGLYRTMRYLPLLFAPQESEYEFQPQGYIAHPLEEYSYSEIDKHSKWYITNTILNNISGPLTRASSEVVFWEFDSLIKNLEGTDWHDVANEVLLVKGREND